MQQKVGGHLKTLLKNALVKKKKTEKFEAAAIIDLDSSTQSSR